MRRLPCDRSYITLVQPLGLLALGEMDRQSENAITVERDDEKLYDTPTDEMNAGEMSALSAGDSESSEAQSRTRSARGRHHNQLVCCVWRASRRGCSG